MQMPKYRFMQHGRRGWLDGHFSNFLVGRFNLGDWSGWRGSKNSLTVWMGGGTCVRKEKGKRQLEQCWARYSRLIWRQGGSCGFLLRYCV